jgi:hypothetical protein
VDTHSATLRHTLFHTHSATQRHTQCNSSTHTPSSSCFSSLSRRIRRRRRREEEEEGGGRRREEEEEEEGGEWRRMDAEGTHLSWPTSGIQSRAFPLQASTLPPLSLLSLHLFLLGCARLALSTPSFNPFLTVQPIPLPSIALKPLICLGRKRGGEC